MSAPASVLGGGSFGTVLASIIAGKGTEVRLWLRNPDAAREIQVSRRNTAYLPDCELGPALTATADLAAAVAGAGPVFVAVPSASCREVARLAAPHLPPGVQVISTTKGLEGEGFKLMSQVLAEELPEASIGVLSGPNIAAELAMRRPAAAVIASADEKLRSCAQKLLHCDYFRVYAGSDMYGVELGGALKNIYAIMGGIATALNMGYNAMGLLITRSLAEMSRFAIQLGADPITFLGLAGVGDLLVTCLSPNSRNYRVGYALGQGMSLEQALAQVDQTAEGVNTLRIVVPRARQEGIYMPLADGLYRIIFEEQALEDVISALMRLEQKDDVEFQTARPAD